MIPLNNLKDIFSKQVQDLFQTLNSKFGINFVVVFDLKEQNFVSLYAVNSIVVQDEINRKTFFIKGKQIINLSEIIQQGEIVSKLNILPIVNHTYSENMFGFVGFGIQGY